MVEYLSGNRIQGSSTLSESPPQTSWKELGRTTLSSAGDTVSVGSLANKPYLMVIGHIIPSGNVYTRTWLNGDSGTNYATRYSTNGAADSTITSTNDTVTNESTDTTQYFTVQYINNTASQEKLWITHSAEQESAGAGNSPSRTESVNKWSNTSDAVSTVQQTNESTGDLATDTELVVLGYDPADTTGTNFWQELGTATASGGETTLTATLSSSKKYLHYVMYKIPHSSGDTADLRINSNTGSVYAGRTQSDGGSDYSYSSTSRILTDNGGYTVPSFSTGYIVDAASKEKLVISESISQGTAGSGAPNRRESVGKTSETARITALNMYTPDERGFLAGTYIKVWGSD